MHAALLEMHNLDKPSVLMISIHADPVQPSGAEEGGGTHAYLRELLRDLSFNRHRCAVVTRWADPDLPDRERLSDFSVLYRIKLGDIAPIDKQRLHEFHVTALSQVKTIVDHLDWVPILFHGIYWNSGKIAMELSRNYGVPFVQTVISNGKRRVFEGLTESSNHRIETETEIFRSASVVFCISEEERQDLIKWYQIPANRLIVVGRPISSAFISPAQQTNGWPKRHSVGGETSEVEDDRGPS